MCLEILFFMVLVCLIMKCLRGDRSMMPLRKRLVSDLSGLWGEGELAPMGLSRVSSFRSR